MCIRDSQYRYTLGDYIYEFPAGLVEPDENYHEGAIREMYEETGLKLDPIQMCIRDSRR